MSAGEHGVAGARCVTRMVTSTPRRAAISSIARADLRHALIAQCIAPGARINGEARLARDDIDSARPRLDEPDRRDEPFVRAARSLDCKHHLRSPDEAVLAHHHRHGTGMTGLTRDRDS